MGEFTFVVEKKCPVCEKMTRVTKTKARLITLSTDEDMCVHYKDFNPYFYKIWFCEHCGFAAEEKVFLSPMPAKHKETVANFLNGRKMALEFTEERGKAEAVASFKLGIFSSIATFTSLESSLIKICAGRVITMISAVFGTAIVALPAGIMAAGYMEEIDREADTDPGEEK